ncbi:MFS transporter [Sphaerochaeta sp. PS]|uniref:MFS transporter n=1 Tax=Sphaerochaeta sp. PS TaxID=3076336 RepID=UPI0028A30BE0|nr:MFS transporter [Sphaerochaeta sp. PS]MDT4761678.1 MFS transporter [Sphaerochaeta sp. PS]
MYKKTIRACYLGNFVGALICNLAPLLYITFMHEFSLSFEQVGRLTLLNFFTQIVADLVFSRPVDKWGIRPFITLGHGLAFVGLLLLAFTPRLFPTNPYVGLMVATVVYSSGGGLFELLLSAIVQGIPNDSKERAMSLLHSFYAWGFIVVVVGTTVMLKVFGMEHWTAVILVWSILPLVNFFNFLRVPIAPAIAEEHRTKIRTLFDSKYFLLVVFGIAVGGATEVSMSQWTSAFVESALQLPKAVGDLVGLCMFALFLGIGRAIYGKYGERLSVWKAMFFGSILCIFCYIVAATSPWPLVSLFACTLTGLGSSLLWPGSVVNGAKHFPLAGASLFAMLAAAGDGGASIGPWLIGLTADINPTLVQVLPWMRSLGEGETALRSGMLIGTIYPALMVLALLGMRKMEKGQPT